MALPQDVVTEVSKSKSTRRKGLYRSLCMFEDKHQQNSYCLSIDLQRKGLCVCLDAKTRKILAFKRFVSLNALPLSRIRKFAL